MPTAKLNDLNSYQENINSIRSFVAKPNSQAIKAAELATPEGRRYASDVRSAFSQQAKTIETRYESVITKASYAFEAEGKSIPSAFRQGVKTTNTVGQTETASSYAAIKESVANLYQKSVAADALPKKEESNQVLKIMEKSEPLNSQNSTMEDQVVISKLAYTRNFVNEIDGLSFEQKEAFKLACDQHSQGDNKLSVQSYCENLLQVAEENNITLSENDRVFLENLRDSNRYQNLLVDKVDGNESGLVSTQVVVLRNAEEDHAFIGIQGTNATLRDWKNDTMFGSDELTIEEQWINNVVNQYAEKYSSLDISGHSQGGREAITAAAFLSDENKEKLKGVYSLDGPGYNKKFLEKYDDRFRDIADKMVQVFPEDSVVGHIMEMPGGDGLFGKPYGKVYYVEADAYGNYTTHSPETWRIENGEFVEYTDYPLMPNLIRISTNYLVSKFDSDVLEEFLPPLLNMFTDPDNPNNLSFDFVDNLGENLKSVSLGDAIDTLAFFGVIISEAYLDFEALISPFVNGIPGLLDVISLLDFPGAELLGDVLTLVAIVSGTLGTISKIALVVSVVATLYLKFKAQQKKLEREQYLAQNPRIYMDYRLLESARGHLENANQALIDADKLADTMRNHVSRRKRESWTELIGDVLETIVKITFPVFAVAEALGALAQYAGNALLDLCSLHSDAHLVKGIDTITRTIDNAKSIANAVGVANEGDTFMVIPSTLSFHANQGVDEVKKIQGYVDGAQSAITVVGSHWQAEDYESIKANADKTIEDINSYLTNLNSLYAAVGEIAGAYGNFQDASVQDFQNAAN